MDTLFKPSLYGRYVLLNKIAAGGMAEVFRAKSFGTESFEKMIAIKRLHPHLCEDLSFVKMFINEAKLAATLNHVNVAPIYDFGQQQGLYYIAMEYVRGCDLADLIERCSKRNQSLPLGLAIWLLIEICNGLDYAHRKHDDLGNFLNLIHRDITPQNILLSYEGEVKIADFGIAKVQMFERDETTGGILKGKFSYMSPEQVRGERMDHRSDIFSLGIVAWELLTCQKMFDGPNDYHILEKVREALFIPPRQINPDLPPALEQIIMKALTRSPTDRYGSVGELRLALLRLLSSSRLFPSRAHLSAFVRKLFQDKLQKERAEIMQETEQSRLIWHKHKEHLGADSSLIAPSALSVFPPHDSQAVVEILASAPPMNIPKEVAEEERITGPLPSNLAAISLPPQASIGSGNRFPVASLPPELDLGLNDDEDPTLPDISSLNQDDVTASIQRPQTITPYSPAGTNPVPLAGLPGIPGMPNAMPAQNPTTPSHHMPEKFPINESLGQQIIVPGSFGQMEEDELPFRAGGQRKNWSFFIGFMTFIIGLSLVLLFSQYLLPQTKVPKRTSNPPTELLSSSPARLSNQIQPKPFAPARLIITSQPWARVYLNGRLLNRTPLNELVTPGTYRITILYPNLSRGLKVVKKTYSKIELKAGKTLRFAVKPR